MISADGSPNAAMFSHPSENRCIMPRFLQTVSLPHSVADDTLSDAVMSYVGAKDFLRKFQAPTWNPIGVFMSRQQKRIYEFRTYRLDAAERLLEKDELMKLVWPDIIVEEANLTNNISVLRRALSENGERFIETVPKRGYRFVTDVRKVDLNGAAAGEQ